MSERILQIYGPNDDKLVLIEPVLRFVARLTVEERCRMGWIATSEVDTQKVLGRKGCVVLIKKGDDILSMLASAPHQEQGVCFLMAATDIDFRGQKLYRQVKTQLVNYCRECSECQINRVCTETSNFGVMRVSRELGFNNYGDCLAMRR